MRVQDSYRVLSYYRQAFASVNLTSTYVQVTAGLTEEVDGIFVNCATGSAGANDVQLAFGAAASEVVQLSFHPHESIFIPIKIGQNTRVSINCAGATINTGSITISLLKKI